MANFFLCYECGTTFSLRNDFDEHILVHQAVSLCYQIYEFDKGGLSIIKAKVENQPSKESYKPQAVKLSATFRKASFDCSQRNARKTTTKRNLAFSPDSPSKVSCLKQRKNSQNDVKITKMNKTQDNSAVMATINSETTHSQMDKEFSKVESDESKHGRKASSTDVLVTRLAMDVSGPAHIDFLENQMTNSPKVIEQSKTDVPITSTTVSAGAIIPLSPSTSLTTTTPRQDESTTLEAAPTLPKCLNCDYRSSQGTDMVEHALRDAENWKYV